MQARSLRGDGEVAVSEAPHEVERLLRRALVREAQRVGLHALLDGCPHVRRGQEEAVGGDQTSQRLVRALEVVSSNEQSEPPLAVREVREHRPRQELVPQCLPEPLHLAQRLRVLRPALHVADALPPKLHLEVRLTAPRGVLTPVVRQYLLRRPVRRDPPSQRLQHQLRTLMMRERVGHDEPRVVIHERGQVQPLLPPQQEREDVRLPQLIRLRALESSHRVLALHTRLARLDEPRLVQDRAHLRLRDSERLEPRKRVPDPARPQLRVLLPQRHDRRALRFLRQRPLRRHRPRLRLQRLRTSLPVRAHPLRHRRGRQLERAAHPPEWQLSVHDQLCHLQSKLVRVRGFGPRPLTRRRPSDRPTSTLSLLSSPLHQDLRLRWVLLGVFYPSTSPLNWCAQHPVRVDQAIR